MSSPDNSTPAPADGSPVAEAAAPAPPVARSIGERLRAGRERAGLSIAAAAEKLHLDPKVIEALEADRFAEVGASVYVRGHLRRYGDFVGENGPELVGMYGTRETRSATPDLTQVPHPERRVDPRRLVTPLVVLGSAAVLFGAIWWVLSGSRPHSEVTPAASAGPSAPSTDAPAPLIQSQAVSATPVTLSNAPVLPPAPAAAAAKPPAAAEPGTGAASATRETPARDIRLRLELTNDSWVEVYDSAGQRLFYDVATGGSVQSVSGRGPLRVVLENAAGVTVEVDGQTREIPASAVDGERARFVVNRSGTLSRSR